MPIHGIIPGPEVDPGGGRHDQAPGRRTWDEELGGSGLQAAEPIGEAVQGEVSLVYHIV